MKRRTPKAIRRVIDPNTPRELRIYARDCTKLDKFWTPTQFHYARCKGYLIHKTGDRVYMPSGRDSAFWTTKADFLWFMGEVNRLEGLA